MTTNEKFVSPITHSNNMNFIFASNNDWILPVGTSGRRYLILELDEKNSMRTMTPEQKKEIWNCSPYSLARVLYDIDLTDFQDDADIQTQALIDQKEMNLPDHIDYFYTGVSGNRDLPYGQAIDKPLLYSKFKEQYPNTRSSNIIFNKTLRKLFPSLIEKRRSSDGVRYYIFPSREEVEQAMRKHMMLPDDYKFNLGVDEEDTTLQVQVGVSPESMML
jgi:hypothetical protein